MKCKIFFFFLLTTSILSAQLNYQVKFKRIGEDYGLSNSWVRDIYQDKEGFIWFATGDGLNRFDAYECKVYRPQNSKGVSFGGVFINDIETKSEDELWVSTNTGMYVFVDNQLLPFQDVPSVSYDEVVNQNEQVDWIIGTRGLLRFNKKDNSFVNVSKDPDHITYKNRMRTGFKDSKGNIWFGGSQGCVFVYNVTNKEFEKINQFENLDRSTSNDILAITEDKSGRIWIGFGQNGLYYQSKKDDNSFKKHSEGSIINILVDKDNILWVAKAASQGLQKIDLNTGKEETFFYSIINPKSISDSSIFSLLEDEAGDLWVGTFGGGANYYSKRNKKIFTVEQGYKDRTFKSNLVNSISEDSTSIWVGTEGGVERVNKKTQEFKHYSYEKGNSRSLRRDPVQCIYTDSNNNVWVGVWSGGLHKYNYKSDDFKRYASSVGKIDNVITIGEEQKKRLWIGTSGQGLFKYNKKEDKLESYFKNSKNLNGFPQRSVVQIQTYGADEVLINTYNSIDFFNPDTGSNESYDLGSQLKTAPVNILCSYVDSKQQVWVGSNIGLFKFNRKTKKFIPYDSDKKMDNLSIHGIIEDRQKNIWISSNSGIFNINRSTKVITRLTKQDGLTTNDFKRKSIFRSKSGVLYFGSSKGMNCFVPEQLVLNEKAPNLAITSLAVLKSRPNKNNEYEYVLENLSSSQEITLNDDQSSFVISFTGLNYLDPEKNTYKYKLEGYDKEWVDSRHRRTATYTNLKEGNYTFKVKGTNNDGIESTAVKEIIIFKKGPWYLSDWFKTLLGILIISLPFVFYFVRLSIFRKQREKLRKKVFESTEELIKANELLTQQKGRIERQNEELSNHRNNLEGIVAKRTEELEEAKMKAEESDKLKSAFIANMSHEIRTPMNAIYGFSGLLGEEDTSTEEQGEYIDIIKESCESLLVLIDDILDISIMDAQGIKLNRQEIDVNEFLRHIEIVLKKKEKSSAPLSFITNTNERVIINTDPIRLRQILNNLINNAIKFTEEGSVQFGYAKEKGQIIFFVKDTGIGVSKKDLVNIFKPFIKAGNNASKIFRGTGIGLSISERIVKTFKGEIWVESELGKGATFYVKLPV